MTDTTTQETSTREHRFTRVGSLTLQWLVLLVAVRIGLWIVPGLQPAIQIELRSDVAGASQLFWAEAGQYSETASSKTALLAGRNTLDFPITPLLGSVGDEVRWDPADVPAEVAVSRIDLRGVLGTERVPVTAVAPSEYLSAFTVDGAALLIKTGANDGQTLIKGPFSRFVWRQEGALLAISATLASVTLWVTIAAMRRRARASTWSGTTLDESFDPRSNALNFVRLVLAILVIAGHSDRLGGFGSFHQFGFLGEGIAVDAFFGLSGFLMARTWSRRPQWKRYLWHRVTRLVPAFWFALLIVGFVAAPVSLALQGAPVSTVLDGSDGAVAYVIRNSTLWLVQTGVAGTPMHVPLENSWNGSLWTMGWTASFDILLVLLGLLGLIRQRWFVGLGALVAWLAYVVLYSRGFSEVGPERGSWLVPVGILIFFLLGVLAFQWRERVRLSWPWAVLAATVVIAAEWRFREYYLMLAAVPLVYLVLYLSSRLRVRWGSRNDLSYGLYLFGFPAQQIVAALGFAAANWWLYTGASILLALPFAAVCWLGVERRAMEWREWQPSGTWLRLLPRSSGQAIVFVSLVLTTYVGLWYWFGAGSAR